MKYKEGPREQERAKERKREGCVCVEGRWVRGKRRRAFLLPSKSGDI